MKLKPQKQLEFARTESPYDPALFTCLALSKDKQGVLQALLVA
ncbi:hypothetical protein [Pasteurella testudinis]